MDDTWTTCSFLHQEPAPQPLLDDKQSRGVVGERRADGDPLSKAVFPYLTVQLTQLNVKLVHNDITQND